MWWLHDGDRFAVAGEFQNHVTFFHRTYLLSAVRLELADADLAEIHRLHYKLVKKWANSILVELGDASPHPNAQLLWTHHAAKPAYAAAAGLESSFQPCDGPFHRADGPDMETITGIAAQHGIEFVQERRAQSV